MPTGTTLPVKDSSIIVAGATPSNVDECNITFDGDLVDISTTGSAGADELQACFRRATITCNAPYVIGNIVLAWGAAVTFAGTIKPGGTPLVFTIGALVSNIKLLGKVKDVWRVQLELKSTGTFTAALT